MALRQKEYKIFQREISLESLYSLQNAVRRKYIHIDPSERICFDDKINQIFEYQEIRDAVYILPSPLRLIIFLRYGFYGPPLSQGKIGAIVNLSQSQVSRLEKKAITILKQIIINNSNNINTKQLSNAYNI